MKALICIDRDGVLLHDEKYYLGKTHDWKKKMRILPGVVEGIKKLNKLPDVAIYMITNQPGVAVKNFKLLTLERAHQVCQAVVDRLKKRGAISKGYFLCAHASPTYTKRKVDFKFHKSLICNCSCIKPNPGMVFDALEAEGITADKAHIYVIGDRDTDVQTALNIGGIGVHVPFINEPEQEKKVKRKYKDNKKVYLAKDFKDAANFIYRREK